MRGHLLHYILKLTQCDSEAPKIIRHALIVISDMLQPPLVIFFPFFFFFLRATSPDWSSVFVRLMSQEQHGEIFISQQNGGIRGWFRSQWSGFIGSDAAGPCALCVNARHTCARHQAPMWDASAAQVASVGPKKKKKKSTNTLLSRRQESRKKNGGQQGRACK